MSDVTLGIKITADAKGARAEISSLSGDLTKLESSGQKAAGGIDSTAKASDKAARDLRNAGSAVDKARGGFDALGISVARLAGAFTGLSVAGIATYVVKTAAEFDRLNASLRTVTGSVEGQQKAMDMIKSFAAQTPYELQQVTEAFIRLRSLGLEASEKSLRSFGNTASAMGKPLMQFIEAVADASTNEFERLKEFGIKASQEGDKVTFTFRGVSTTVQKTSEEITKYLQNIGNTEFSGGMAQQMDTLSGKASNLADAFANLAESFANASGLKSGIKGALDEITESVNYLGKSMELAFGAAKNAPVQALELQLQDLQERLNEMDNLKTRGFGGFVDDQVYEKTNEELRKTSELLEKLTVNTKTAGEEFSAVTTKAGNAGQAIESMSRAQIEIMQKVAAEAKRQGVEIAAALAIAEQESSFNQSARAKTKYGDAVGVMQLIPPTAKSLGVDASNLEQNIEGGIRLIKKVEAELVAALGEKGRDIQLVAAAYFTGTQNVVNSIKKNGALPGYSDGNKTVPDYVADFQAKRSKYIGSEKEITAAVDSELKDRQKSYSDHFDAVQTLAKASAKAQETIAKSAQAVELAKLNEQRKAFDDFVRARSGELTGQNQTQFLEQAARTETNLIQQSVTLKQRAIDIERQATQAELASVQARIQAKEQLKLSESQVAALMGDQKELTAELASYDAQSSAVRIQGAGELQQVLSGVADAYAKQAEAAQQAAAARDDLLKNMDAEIAALEKGVQVRNEVAQAEKAAADLGKDQHDAYMKQVNARVARLDELKKADDDRSKQEKAVADQVLRTGQYYEAMVRQAQNAAQGMAAAFGETGAAIGQLVVGLAQYQDTMFNIQQRTDALLKANRENGGGADREMEIRAQAMNQELTAQINNYGNLTQAAQSFFDKGTSGYQAMENATKVFRAVELAMTLANYVKMAVAGWTFTGQDAAQKQVQGQNAALVGIANQATGGDPYSAFPRMAAMAAAMAALGFAVAGGMSGGSAPSGAVSRSGPKSSGTVFGDSSAQSNSLANALDLVAKNSSTDLAYSAAMLRSLQNIEAAMAGVTNSVIRTVRPADVQGLGTRQTISWDPFAIFLKTTKAITDWGIGAFPQALKTILASGFEGKTFTDVTTSVKFFGMTLSSSTKTMIGDMASETEKQFTLAFRSIADTVREASKAFGTSSEDFNRMVETFVVKFDTTSLKGLKGEELENAIQQQFSKIADQIAGALDIQGLDQFQRVGEGMFETLVRVADGINTANGELAALGIEAVKYSEIQFKQGDVAAEIVRQSIVAFEGLNSGIGEFIDQAVGSAEELIQTYQDLLASRDILKGLGLEFQNLGRTMTDAAGGASAFRDALESFRDNFYNQGEQLSADLVTLAREFGNLGQALPKSKDEFRDLAEGIDTSTDSGAELFARIIKLSDAFASAADKAAELEDKYRSYTDPYADFKSRIETVMSDFADILSGKLGIIEAEFASRASVEKYQANSPLQGQIDITTSRRSSLASEINATLGYLNQTNAEIGRLQDLIARWEGVPKAQGYVAAWRSALDGMQRQAETLVKDLTGKNKELDTINARIADLQSQIAANSADIDASLLGEKLKEMTQERNRILREQGRVLVQTMRDIWDGVMSVIEDAQRSIAGNIAKLQGGNATSKLLRGDERDATRDLNQYIKHGGKDPQKIADMVIAAQNAIMASFEDRADRLIEKYKKSAEYKLAVKDLEAEAREKIKPIREALRDDIREINAAAREKIKPIREQAQADTKAVRGAAEANIANLQSRSTARIAELTAQMDAAVQALEDRQQAEQDALQGVHDARMQQLQDEHQAVIEMLQEGKHYQQQQSLDETHYQQQQALDDVHFYQMRALSDEHDAQMRALNDVHQAQLDAINDVHQAQMDALSEQQDARAEQLSDAQDAASKAFSKQQQAQEKALQKSLQQQMDAAEKQASAAKEFADAIKQVAEFAKSLSTSKYSPLSPEAQLAESKRVYEETLAKARSGDAEAAQKYAPAAQDYLDKSEAYNARNADYAATFAKVQADANSLGSKATNADATEAAIERLRESQEAQLDALRESQEAAADSFRKGQEAQTKALQKTFDAQQKALQSALDEQMKSAQRAQEEQTRALQRTQEDESRALQKVQQEESRAQQKVQQEESRALQKAQAQELESLRRVQETESKALQKVFSDEMRALQRSQEAQSDAIRTAFQSQIDSIENRTNDRIDTINNRMDRKIEEIQTKAQKDIDAIRTKADKDIDRVTNHANTRIDNIQNRLHERIDKLALNPPGLQELKDETIAKLQALDTVLQNTKNEARKQFQEQVEILKSANVLSARQLQQLNNIGASLGAGQTGVPAYAKGGVLKPGPAIVGEAGIEPVWFDRGGRVISNAEAKSALSDGDKKIAQAIAELKHEVMILTKAQVAANSRIVQAVEVTATETAYARRDAKIRPTKGVI